jgi:hypothetical protein
VSDVASGWTGEPATGADPSTSATPSSPLPPTTKPLRCSSANFAVISNFRKNFFFLIFCSQKSLRKSCCLQFPVLELVPYERGDKSCPNGKAAMMRAFNAYTLNKQQNANLGHALRLADPKVQKNLLKDAVTFFYSLIFHFSCSIAVLRPVLPQRPRNSKFKKLKNYQFF